MPPTSGDLWGTHLLPDSIDLEVLLPNGFMISVLITRESTIKDVKEGVWQEAKTQPLFHLLEHKESYVLVGLTLNGEEEEFYDESRRLYELRLGVYSMRIVLPKGNKTENILNSEVGQCIGISVSDLNKMAKIPEISAFRHELLSIAKENTANLLAAGDDGVLSYMCEGTQSVEISHRLNVALQNMDSLFVSVVLASTERCGAASDKKLPQENSRHSLKLQKSHTVRETLSEIMRIMGKYRIFNDLRVDNYVLKCCCTQTYMTNLDERLISYCFIQRCLLTAKTPILQAVSRSELYAKLNLFDFVQPTYAQIGSIPNEHFPKSGENTILEIGAQNFFFFVKCGQYVCSKEACKLYVRCGIYHGSESIVPHCTTAEKASSSPYWNEKIEFNIQLLNIPRAARLCLALIQRTEKKSKSIEYPVGWANINLFDYLGRFVKGTVLLPLTPHSQFDDNSSFLNPSSISSHYMPLNLSLSGSIPSDTVCLSLEFKDYGQDVFFPNIDDVVSRGGTFPAALQPGSHNSLNLKMKEIVSRDPLSDISEQEKEFLWNYRDMCRLNPNSLPRLAQSVKWHNLDDVAVFYNLITQWNILEPEIALELLGCNYMDPFLRHFAVHSLDQLLSDQNLGQYLLQLTQTLKCEPYLVNPITKCLLRRALRNIDLALPFFWYLRSEMHLLSSRTRFGFILEALCRGCGPLLKKLYRQTEVVDQLSAISEFVKSEDREEEQFKLFKEKISRNDVREMIEDFTSPLDKNFQIGTLKIESCEIKKSKKRPLWLVWDNPDPLSRMHLTEYKLIFKHGDDLRQDMLTLQILRLMDKIWELEGCDMQLVPYGCLATGQERGIIEAVNDAQTVMSIQKKQLKSAIQIDPSQLHRWLQERNPGEAYEIAINNFTKSCAAYCVATFILGIRDRHPDNIMLNKSGQLFHIDFGHFLNNRKKKFGINRERVPFILTEDFVFVIAKGADKPYKSPSFRKFMDSCAHAYLKLRRHAKLFLTLFTMMIPCGIPELTSVTDLEYLRKTLAVEMNDKEAVEYFNSKFCEAYNGAWTTKMDWFSHWVRN